MITKSDFLQYKELRGTYTPETRGVVSSNEAKTIRSVLELEQRTDIELQNIRNLCVILYSHDAEYYREKGDTPLAMLYKDAVSAVTAVIDNERVRRGLEI